MKGIKRDLFFVSFILIIVYFMSYNILAQSSKKQIKKEGKVTYVENIVKRKNVKLNEDWKEAKVGEKVKSGDKVKTHAKSRAEIVLAGLSVIRLAPKTTIDIEKLYEEKLDKKLSTKINVEEGEIWSNTEKLDEDLEFEVNTDVAGMAIKGTVFRVVKKDNGNTLLKVYRGAVAVSNKPALNKRLKNFYQPNRYEVSGPKEISGPREVSLKEWLEIVKSMQEIEISKDGLLLFKRNFDLSSPEEKTEWVRWNMKRDSILEAQRKNKKIR